MRRRWISWLHDPRESSDRSAAPRAPFLSAPEPGHHAVVDQVVLELRDGAEVMKQEPARRCRRVDRLVKRNEIHAERLELAP